MLKSLIVARATNGVIGRDNQLPWHLPDDLKHFRALTMGKPIIMGRLTWESIGKPLPGRTSIVVSSAPATDFPAEVLLVRSLAEAWQKSIELPPPTDLSASREAVVIGGSGLYRDAIAEVDRIYLTEVHADVTGDTHFPGLEADYWQEISRDDRQADDRHNVDFSFVTLGRR